MTTHRNPQPQSIISLALRISRTRAKLWRTVHNHFRNYFWD